MLISMMLGSFKALKLVYDLVLPENRGRELSFDVDSFRKIKTETENTIIKLQKARSDTMQSIEELRSSWKTPAGEVFFQEMDNSWVTSVEKYESTLKVFSDILDELIETFSGLEERINALDGTV